MTWGRRLQSLDRRWIYLLTALVIGFPFLPGVKIPVPPPVVQPPTQAYYDTIEAIADDPVESKKLVILANNYSSGTFAENQSQYDATLRHLMRRKLKFALFAFNDPQGRDLGLRVAERLTPSRGYVYGENWCSFGYRPADGINQVLKTMSNDLQGGLVNDAMGQPIGSLPVMAGIKSADDISLVVNFASAQTIDSWVQFFSRPDKSRLPLLYGPTSVMVPEAYPYLRSGQIAGMLSGIKGAIEYETLLKEPGFASSASASLSWAHFLIIGLIVVGNVGMFLERKRV